jgi:competence protein ComEC
MKFGLCGAVMLASSLYGGQTLDFYFVDVEVGNAVLVVTPAGEALLLDTGPPGPKYIDRLLKAINDAGVKQIDFTIISHYHWDHYGTVPELVKHVPIAHYIDHGVNVDENNTPEHYLMYGGGAIDRQYRTYVQTRDRSDHVVAQPGDRVPVKGLELTILTSHGDRILNPLPGGGQANKVCATSSPRFDDTSEDGQSVGVLLQFGKFRFVDLGDLTWNKSLNLFCPANLVGAADLYLITHHGISEERHTVGEPDWGRSSATPPEVYGLHPRAAILSAGEDYVGRLSTSEYWQVVRHSPGLEDIWQLHYQTQGGPENNAPEQFVANMHQVGDGGYYIKVSASADGSFTITNGRNGFTKKYAARRAE